MVWRFRRLGDKERCLGILRLILFLWLQCQSRAAAARIGSQRGLDHTTTKHLYDLPMIDMTLTVADHGTDSMDFQHTLEATLTDYLNDSFELLLETSSQQDAFRGVSLTSRVLKTILGQAEVSNATPTLSRMEVTISGNAKFFLSPSVEQEVMTALRSPGVENATEETNSTESNALTDAIVDATIRSLNQGQFDRIAATFAQNSVLVNVRDLQIFVNDILVAQGLVDPEKHSKMFLQGSTQITPLAIVAASVFGVAILGLCAISIHTCRVNMKLRKSSWDKQVLNHVRGKSSGEKDEFMDQWTQKITSIPVTTPGAHPHQPNKKRPLRTRPATVAKKTRDEETLYCIQEVSEASERTADDMTVDNDSPEPRKQRLSIRKAQEKAPCSTNQPSTRLGSRPHENLTPQQVSAILKAGRERAQLAKLEQKLHMYAQPEDAEYVGPASPLPQNGTPTLPAPPLVQAAPPQSQKVNFMEMMRQQMIAQGNQQLISVQSQKMRASPQKQQLVAKTRQMIVQSTQEQAQVVPRVQHVSHPNPQELRKQQQSQIARQPVQFVPHSSQARKQKDGNTGLRQQSSGAASAEEIRKQQMIAKERVIAAHDKLRPDKSLVEKAQQMVTGQPQTNDKVVLGQHLLI